MAKKNKKAKFYCENCGAEVPINAKFCRHCGRFFSSVRCPQCGATGSPDKFVSGCPVCGYAIEGATSEKTRKNTRLARALLGSSVYKRNRAIRNDSLYNEDPLPFWMYLLIFAALILVLFLFLRFFL